MSWFRGFSAEEEHVPPVRTLEDAPDTLRHEVLDLVFHLAEHNRGGSLDDHFYNIVCQNCGEMGAGNPYGGFRRGASRVIGHVAWPRIYDLIVRLWPEFGRTGQVDEYRQGVNAILAGHGVAWELGEEGRLNRVLPAAAQAQVEAAIQELRDPRYTPALQLFNAARDAYDDRPRRDRDACANVFDSMESVAKEKFGMPNATFGQVAAHMRATGALNEQIVGMLEAVNTLRNRNFGHGMVAPFTLRPAEVDFTYLTCIGAMLLFARTP